MLIFYQNLKAWRRFRGLTQAELASRSGIPRPNLVTLERGRRECTLSTLNRLASSLDMSPGALLDQPPLTHRKPLDRHQIDRIAKSLLDPKLKLSPDLLPLKEYAASQARPLLQAAGVKGKRGKKPSLPQDKIATDQVLRRLAKLIPGSLLGSIP